MVARTPNEGEIVLGDITGFRVKHWSSSHEVTQSRRIRNALPWVAVPTSQGRGYCRLTRLHGARGLGVWLALLEVSAARPQEDRGRMIRCSLADLADMTRLPEEEIQEVLPTLLDLGWLEVETPPAEASEQTVDDPSPDDQPTVDRPHTAGGEPQPMDPINERSTGGTPPDDDGSRSVYPRTDGRTDVRTGRTDGRDGTDGRTPQAPRRRGDLLLRRFMKGGSPPDGFVTWDTYWADLAMAGRCSAEVAQVRWIEDRGGAEALALARQRGLL